MHEAFQAGFDVALSLVYQHSFRLFGQGDTIIHTQFDLSRTRYKIYLSNFDDDIRSEVVETSVITNDNSPSQEHPRPDHKTTRWHANPGFKPFTSCVITKIIQHNFGKAFFIFLQKVLQSTLVFTPCFLLIASFFNVICRGNM